MDRTYDLSSSHSIAMLPSMATGKSSGAVSWFWFATSAGLGVAVEIIISQMGHRRESWDSPYYWKFGVPVMIAGALICGFVARRSRVGIGYAPFLSQLITMVVRTGGGSMLPLGIILIGIIGLSGVLAAFVGAALGKRMLGNTGSSIERNEKFAPPTGILP